MNQLPENNINLWTAFLQIRVILAIEGFTNNERVEHIELLLRTYHLWNSEQEFKKWFNRQSDDNKMLGENLRQIQNILKTPAGLVIDRRIMQIEAILNITDRFVSQGAFNRWFGVQDMGQLGYPPFLQ